MHTSMISWAMSHMEIIHEPCGSQLGVGSSPNGLCVYICCEGNEGSFHRAGMRVLKGAHKWAPQRRLPS